MVKTLLKSVRQYKRVSIETPLFVTMEVILECTIPLIMSKLIDDMTGTSMAPILKYGALLLVLATLSLLFGVLSARAAATAGCGLAKISTLRPRTSPSPTSTSSPPPLS